MTKLLATFLLSLCFASMAQAGDSPVSFVQKFYEAQQQWKIRGVPQQKDMAAVKPFIGRDIYALFEKVNDQRVRWAKQFPYDPNNAEKPPWTAEGDVFSDLYEGYSEFKVGKAKEVDGRQVVEVALAYTEGGETSRWTDKVVLEKAGESWVVFDLLFERGGSLKASLKKAVDEIERELKAPAQ